MSSSLEFFRKSLSKAGCRNQEQGRKSGGEIREVDGLLKKGIRKKEEKKRGRELGERERREAGCFGLKERLREALERFGRA